MMGALIGLGQSIGPDPFGDDIVFHLYDADEDEWVDVESRSDYLRARYIERCAIRAMKLKRKLDTCHNTFRFLKLRAKAKVGLTNKKH